MEDTENNIENDPQELKENSDEEESFSEASNPEELDFDEKDYVELDFANPEEEKSSPGQAEIGEVHNTLSQDHLKNLTSKIEENMNPNTLKKFLIAFSSAVHLEDSEYTKKILIPDTTTFQELMVFGFQELPTLLKKYLSAGKKKYRVDEERLEKMTHLLKNYISNYILFLGKLNDSSMIEFILSHSLPLSSFVSKLKPYHIKFVKLAIKIWSETENPKTQLFSFVLIREIAKENDPSKKENEFYTQILKRCYKSYAENSRIIGWKNYDSVQFMRNCYAELIGLNLGFGYQQGYTQIRKMCLELRTVVKQSLTKENIRKVFNWRFLNCIKLWTQCITGYRETDMILLVTPLVQLCFGILKLQSINSRFLPYHLKIIETLNELSMGTKSFIPTSTFCLEVLDMQEFKKVSKNCDEKIFDYELAIKIPKNQLRTKEAQEVIANEAINLIVQFCAINSKCPFFSEMSIPLVHSLQKIKKKLYNKETKKRVSEISGKIEQDGKNIEKIRNECKQSTNYNNGKWEEIEKILEENSCAIQNELNRIQAEKKVYKRKKILAEKETPKIEESND